MSHFKFQIFKTFNKKTTAFKKKTLTFLTLFFPVAVSKSFLDHDQHFFIQLLFAVNAIPLVNFYKGKKSFYDFYYYY